MDIIFGKIIEALEQGNKSELTALVQEALDNGAKPSDIANYALAEGMNLVGELYREGEIFVPEVLMASAAMEQAMDLLRPYLKENDIKEVGRILFCTVKGDLHDIGKNLCVMMLENAGYRIIDLGVDIGVTQIVDAVKEQQPNLVALSSNVTTRIVTMEQTVEALKENGFDHIPVMVGGAPLSGKYADEIGANYSEDAVGCVELANRLLGIN